MNVLSSGEVGPASRGRWRALRRNASTKKTTCDVERLIPDVASTMKMTGENSAGGSEITMDDVKNLVKKKDEIEEQIKAYYDVLADVSLLSKQTRGYGH